MVRRVVLVTGGTGLVGRSIEEAVSEEKNNNKTEEDEQWIFVGSKDADLCDLESTRALFARHCPTHVIHLAAMVGGLFHNMSNNLHFLVRNPSPVQNPWSRSILTWFRCSARTC